MSNLLQKNVDPYIMLSPVSNVATIKSGGAVQAERADLVTKMIKSGHADRCFLNNIQYYHECFTI